MRDPLKVFLIGLSLAGAFTVSAGLIIAAQNADAESVASINKGSMVVAPIFPLLNLPASYPAR